MEKLFSIGEISKIKKITIKALRYYHKVGILVPKHIDKTTGYRYYSIDQFIYIDIIKSCRDLGTSIAELQEIFKKCDTDKLLSFLQIKKQEAKENIIKMEAIIHNIDILSEGVEYSKSILNNNEIEIKYFEKRYIVTVTCREVGNLKELFYYSDLDKVIEDKNIEISMERGILYNFNLKGEIEPLYAFNVVKENYNIKGMCNIKTLPMGKYLTLSYSKENMEEARDKISSYIKKNKLKVKHIIEIDLINDFFNTNSYSCEIQIFIEDKR